MSAWLSWRPSLRGSCLFTTWERPNRHARSYWPCSRRVILRVMTDYGFVYTPYPRDVALAANDGSLLLRFHDFHERDHFVLSTTYFGFVYSLYPKRAYVADHTRVINNGFDILEADFSPDGEWLEQHDVRSIVHFLRRPDDTAEIRLQRLIQTSQDGRPKGVRN